MRRWRKTRERKNRRKGEEGETPPERLSGRRI